MANNIPPQDSFLYKGRWTAEVDSVMLSVIIREKRANNWSGTVIPIPVLEEAVATISLETGVSFTWRELYERFQFMEKRYHAFNLVTRTRGVSWYVHSNTIIGPEPTWKALFQKNQLAAAYFYYGDPEWSRLTMLFGKTKPKTEPNSNVIEISDTTVPVPEEDANPSPHMVPFDPFTEVSESVSSPLVANVNSTRRKLFSEDYHNLDIEESIETCPIFRHPGTSGAANHKPATRPSARVKKFNPAESPHGSSCGSTSPANWWRNNMK
ncbi:uncharacterized protein LOC121810814 [Salvia splendens]|nr:uncharacterized protein LOC121810814 [Salvia splendens]